MRLAALRGWLGRERAAPSPGDMPDIALQALVAMSGQDTASPPARVDAQPAARPAMRGAHGLAVADTLWGEGFQMPGGATEVLRLANPLGLSEAASVLLLGAATGGPPLEIAAETGAWVSGYEIDPELAEAAAHRLARSTRKRAKHATIAVCDLASPGFRRNGFNHAITLDALRGPRIPDLLASIALALKSGGQLVMVQTVAEGALDPGDPVVATWRRLERRDELVPRQADITRVLKRLGFDVRVVEDVTERHVQLTLSGWTRLVRGMVGGRPQPARAAAIVEAAEMWMRRIHLLQTGQLRFVRWHALGGINTKGGGA